MTSEENTHQNALIYLKGQRVARIESLENTHQNALIYLRGQSNEGFLAPVLPGHILPCHKALTLDAEHSINRKPD